jgi:hypothetical protein
MFLGDPRHEQKDSFEDRFHMGSLLFLVIIYPWRSSIML